MSKDRRYKDIDEALRMGQYYEKLADDESRKKILIEQSVRTRILELLKDNKISQEIGEGIKRDIGLIEDVRRQQKLYEGWSHEAYSEAMKIDASKAAEGLPAQEASHE